MQNDHQSSESVILGVDTHLDIHVGAVISQAGKLLGTHIIQTNQSGYLELLISAQSLNANPLNWSLTRTIPWQMQPALWMSAFPQ
ncbi:hypothetical protein [Enterobacter kobei]|uniref:hypothetical protein n=1 Tax=Enterobacter kobei TaxID=208224 RepID=UPI003CEBFC08